MRLNKQAAKCKFGDSIEDSVGIWDENTRKRLLSNLQLTFQKAVDRIQIEKQVERN